MQEKRELAYGLSQKSHGPTTDPTQHPLLLRVKEASNKKTKSKSD